MNLWEGFEHPKVEFKSMPFWAWNGMLDADELRWQVEELKSGGYGGFFMHARVGLLTPYVAEDGMSLSDEWLSKVRTAVSEAKKQGMQAWLYDEDRWPSGFAGGIVPRINDKFRLQGMLCREKDGSPVFMPSYAPDSEWFNGSTYIDTLNPDAMDAFIESTYEAYCKSVGREFGDVIPGIFTDEPAFSGYWADDYMRVIPWTDGFPKYFRQKKGYGITEHLESLFYNRGNFTKIRYDYWDTVTGLFAETFSKRLYDWCGKHKLKLTGHYLAEDTLTSQIRALGAAMPNYEYMHMPGVDHLCKNLYNMLTIKQVASAAHQLGKERVLSEAFGGSGWSFTPKDQKWVGDWQLALGINFFTPHLAYYSMAGGRKKDWPPSIFYQLSWWKYHNIISDYFARLCYMLSSGKFAADILVLHPISTGWVLYTPLDTSDVDMFNGYFCQLLEFLSQIHRDYDLGDEKLIEKYADVSGSRLMVGKMEYRAVIVPPAVTLRASTFKLLCRFVQNGGRLIAIKPLPYLIDGEDSRELQDFWKLPEINVLGEQTAVIPEGKAAIKDALSTLPPEISVLDMEGYDAESIFYQHRISEDKHIYFLANTDSIKGCHARIKIPVTGKTEGWNPLTGKREVLRTDEKGWFNMHFPPAGSNLLVVDTACGGERESISEKTEDTICWSANLPERWKFARRDPNVLVLDYCRFRLNGEWLDYTYMENVQKQLESSCIERDVSLQFSFFCSFSMPPGELFLAVENPGMYMAVSVNGARISDKGEGWYIDKSIKKIDIRDYVKTGENIIELSYRFAPLRQAGTLVYNCSGTEVASLYIVGDFAVSKIDNRFILTEETNELCRGNFTAEGYPFFSGTMALYGSINILDTADKKVILELGKLDAAAAEVDVNGKPAGVVLWEPRIVDITPFVYAGENLVKLNLTSTPRNLFGPHHLRGGDERCAAPDSFREVTSEYSLLDFGMVGGRIYCLAE